MILQLMPFSCDETMEPLSNYFYSLAMTLQIAMFSRMTALASIHFVIVMLCVTFIHAIALGVVQPNSPSSYSVFVVINSVLATLALTSISCVLT